MARRSASSRRKSQSRRRPGSGRALALAVILFFFTFSLASPIKNYFTQRAQINAIKSQLSSDNAALLAARKELELWKDPEYIKSQARERLHFVAPGERQYLVTDSKGGDGGSSGAQIEKNLPAGQPWYSRMIASITEAGKP